MPRINWLAVGVLLALSGATLLAQKPAQTPKDPFAPRPAHASSKATPPFLAGHRDNSSAILANPRHTKTSSELDRLERQSAHAASSSASKAAHVRAIPLPRVADEKNVAINFNGKSTPKTPMARPGSAPKPGAGSPVKGPSIH